MTKPTNKSNRQSGYALFTSIMLTGTLILVAYATTNFSIKQLLLTTSGADSHAAFYVADSGVECALYWDLKNGATSAFDPNSPAANINCGGASNTVTSTNGGGSPINVSQGKNTSQVSTYDSITVSSNAVDGDTNGSYPSGSITHANWDPNGWWQVDLGSSVPVSSVVVWNRTDCCGYRLDDYWVFISDTPFGPSDTADSLQSRAGTWSNHQTSYPDPSVSINAGGTAGRYVRVQLSGTNAEPYLSLAEVQVFSPSSVGSGSSTFQIPVGTSCANVTVTKNGVDTTIESKGYNTCSGNNRLERAIRITY